MRPYFNQCRQLVTVQKYAVFIARSTNVQANLSATITPLPLCCTNSLNQHKNNNYKRFQLDDKEVL